MNRIFKLAISIVSCELVGAISTPLTIHSIPTWYAALNKPVFSPPNSLFGIVWAILYFLMGYSCYLIWEKGKNNRSALTVFVLQLFFNLLWSVLFFGLHKPFLAFIDIIVLWSFIFLTINSFNAISKVAAYLLVPYFLWVSFAAMLNLSIAILN